MTKDCSSRRKLFSPASLTYFDVDHKRPPNNPARLVVYDGTASSNAGAGQAGGHHHHHHGGGYHHDAGAGFGGGGHHH